MALPTLAKTWLFNVNQATGSTGTPQGDNQEHLFTIKQSLIGFAGGYWTVTSSSDGATADLSDLWVTVGNVGWGTVERSWIVLTNSATGMQICLDCDTNPVSNYAAQVHVIIAPNGGFATTGFDASHPPTPPTVSMDFGECYFGGYAYASAGRVHAMMSDDGKCTRIVSCRLSGASSIWILDEVLDPVTGWTYPNVGIVDGLYNSSGDWITYSNLNSSSKLRGYTDKQVRLHMTSEGYLSNLVGQALTVADSQAGTWPMCPVGLLCAEGGQVGRKGQLYDMWWGSQTLVTGDTYPNDTSYQFVQFGDIILPWNGTVPLVV